MINISYKERLSANIEIKNAAAFKGVFILTIHVDSSGSKSKMLFVYVILNGSCLLYVGTGSRQGIVCSNGVLWVVNLFVGVTRDAKREGSACISSHHIVLHKRFQFVCIW